MDDEFRSMDDDELDGDEAAPKDPDLVGDDEDDDNMMDDGELL